MCLAWVIVTSGIFLEASYMGISSNFGVLYGSVYTLLDNQINSRGIVSRKSSLLIWLVSYIKRWFEILPTYGSSI